jgi:hypothetical protein
MIMITAKFSKKRAVIGVIALGVLLAGIVLLAHGCSRGDDNSNNGNTSANTNSERVAFLKSYGWEIDTECIEEQPVLIPREFGDVYTNYNELQKQQGFDLTKFAGCEVTRYTYRITNYPSDGVAAVADIIVYKGNVIAGDVQSNALNGFMTTLSND